MQGTLFINPNPGTGIKGTPQLNDFSKQFRKTKLFQDLKIKEEGFSMNPLIFKFEWIIDFENRKRLVLQEFGKNEFYYWLYNDTDAPFPVAEGDLLTDNFGGFTKFIKAVMKYE